MSSPSSAALKRKADGMPSSSPADLKKPKTNGSITSFFGAPKMAPGAKPAGAANGFSSAPTSPKFVKAKWVESLTPEQKSLLKLEIDTLDESWLAHLKDELLTPGFLGLKRFLKSEIDSGKKIFPPMEDVYSWSRHTPLSKVKVVITGQDPYHNDNQAHGLSFSVRAPARAPPSLKNMYIALKNDYPSFRPPPNNSGLLVPWAEQGVLMLNACLTVRAHTAASHRGKGWEKFTAKVLETVSKNRTRGVVFLAWGADAQKSCKSLGMLNKGKHVVFESVHPSPLSASRGFFNCGHFKKANDWLSTRYGVEGIIDWNLDKPAPIAAPKVDGPVKVTADQEKVTADEEWVIVDREKVTADQEKDSKKSGSTIGSEKKKPTGGAEGAAPAGDKSPEDDDLDQEDAEALAVMEELARAEDEGRLKLEDLPGTKV